jgi:hypothetical protein
MTELDPTRDRIVVAAEAPNEIIAGLWASVLRDEGIPVMVKSTGPGMAYFSNMGNMHIIYVMEAQAEEAREIIAELEDGNEFEEY